ncbi:uncharacterized protein LOC143066265 [Mytilus galloprovincialis]|uniref:uncharacterized protein LOC143066265 n=1 Tax=Mytilus galloprovincialis TaxID=29158 RepID=UPI003F7BBD65
MEPKVVLFLGIIQNLLFVKASFLGGTISWRVIPHHNTIQFICRTTYEKSTGPCGNPCLSSDKGKTKPSSIFDNIFWQYDNGTITDTKYNLNYILTTVSNTPSYEQGENKFLIPLSNVSRFTLRLNNISWILTGTAKAPASVALKITVNTYIRNDTNMPNASPISALAPYIGIQHSCRTVIKIPVIDPDDDRVGCRWAESQDCDQSCTDLPHAELNQKDCTIELDTNTRNGYRPGQKYRVTLMADDYPRYDVFMNNKIITPQQKMSSTPVQFTIHIVNGPTSCSTGMKFVALTLPENIRVPYPPNRPRLINGVYLETPDVNKTSFVVSLSKGCTYQQLPDDTSRTNVTRLYEVCKVTPRDMIGDALFCVWAMNGYGVTSQPRCVDVIVAGRNECSAAPCMGNETCYNLFMSHSCRCENGYKRPFCIQDTTIWFGSPATPVENLLQTG